jgi:hypothetical protein
MPGISERRNNPRIEKCGDYFLYPKTREEVPCVLKNISVTGACIFPSRPLQMDQVVELHICRTRDLSLKSQVVWENSGEYGLSFLLDSPEDFNNISFIMNNELHSR